MLSRGVTVLLCAIGCMGIDGGLPDPMESLVAGSHRPVTLAFDEHAQRSPDRMAIANTTRSWTYGEVARVANQIAHWLSARGIGPGERVAIHARRTAWTPIAMLGVLKAGATFVLLDADYPRERILAQVAVSTPAAWIDTAGPGVPEWLPAVRHALVCDSDAMRELDALPDTPPGIELAADSIAYVVFTSGTTGVPKAAPATHAGLAHFIEWQSATFKLSATDTFSALSGLAHLPFTRDVFVPLAIGATIAIPAHELRREPEALAAWLAEQRITVANVTPSLARVLTYARGALARDLRLVFFAGELLVGAVVDAMRHIAPAATFVNLYGASETCQSIAFHVVPAGVTGPVPIGRGIDRTQLLLLDDAGALAGMGEDGEICVRTPYLATSYLTGEAGGYGTNPFTGDPADRVYRTGDRGRYLADGSVEHLGRRDLQVKVRGYRVELGEVERAMLHQPGVEQAVAMLGSDGATLAAYVVGALDPTQLAAALRDRLPDYMVPSTIVRLPALPLTANGKLDRRALQPPAPAASVPAVADGPIDELERTIVGVWKDVLGIDHVGRHDNFFDLGGHSLNAIRVAARLREALVAEVAVRTIFDKPTVVELAARLRDIAKPAVAAPPSRIKYRRSRANSARATPSQEFFWYLDRDDHDPASYYQASAWIIEGPLDEAVLAECYRQLVGYHSIYRTAYREVDGVLHQFVAPRKEARLEDLEIVADVPLDEREAAIKRAVAELVARDYDLTLGHGIIRSRLVRFAADSHALVTIVHHIASDLGSIVAFGDQLFGGYARMRAGASRALPDEPPLQYIDFAHAQQQWVETPMGKAQRDLRAERLRGAPPVIVEGDLPRAAIDARRDAVPFGITADVVYPPERAAVASDVYDAVARTCRDAQTTPYVGFLAGLAWLLHARSGQTDISILTSYTPRGEDPLLEPVHGCFTRWTLIRADIAACAGLREVIERVKTSVDALHETGPLHDIYRVVPHELRRVVFNYVPMHGSRDSVRVADLVVTPHIVPLPPWKRPWDLYLMVIDDSQSARLLMTGFEQLFRRSTLPTLLGRLVELLGELATNTGDPR
jgi:amino acid adenylation domain-containing protein